MKIIFGPYGTVLSALGIPPVLQIKRLNQAHFYRSAVEMIARGYLNAGATLPTVNGFFLRSLLHLGFTQLYKEMLTLNFESLMAALGEKKIDRIAICLGPAEDGYLPELAPDVEESSFFAKKQYELCIDVLHHFGLDFSDVVFLHETIGTAREALGISKAAESLKIPLIISFVVDQNGHLMSGETAGEVIHRIDRETNRFVEGFSLNCCSPFALDPAIKTIENKERLIGFYPNSYDASPVFYSDRSVEEPKKMESLKTILQKGRQYNLQFIGGCCGFGYHELKLLNDFWEDR